MYSIPRSAWDGGCKYHRPQITQIHADEAFRLIEYLAELQLSRADLSNTAVTTSDLDASHYLWNRPVRDEDLLYIASLSQLQVLNLAETQITDSGIKHLSPSTNLASLTLSGTQITDRGLGALQELENLERLVLGATFDEPGSRNRRTIPAVAITDDALQSISQMTQLQSLDLRGSGVTDAGLVHLRKLRRLRELNLIATAITDVGLEHLVDMKSLEILQLTERVPVFIGPGPITQSLVSAEAGAVSNSSGAPGQCSGWRPIRSRSAVRWAGSK